MDLKRFAPFVSPDTKMKELTLRAVLLGVIMAMFMGAANAYLGLKPDDYRGHLYHRCHRLWRLSSLPGTIWKRIAPEPWLYRRQYSAGAIFTLPAFFMPVIWQPFFTVEHYIVCTIILVVGGILGIMFVTITRRYPGKQRRTPLPRIPSPPPKYTSRPKRRWRVEIPVFRHGPGYLVYFTHGIVKSWGLKFQKIFSLVERKGSILLRGPEMSPAFFGVGFIIGS